MLQGLIKGKGKTLNLCCHSAMHETKILLTLNKVCIVCARHVGYCEFTLFARGFIDDLF